MNEKSYYESLMEKLKNVVAVGEELHNKQSYCRESAKNYEEIAAKKEIEGQDGRFYRDWADSQREQAKIWERVEELFRAEFIGKE